MSELFPRAFEDLLQRAMRRVRSLRVRRAENELRARKSVRAARGAFAGHRPYAAGVDVRDVDWAAYARSRELFAKTFEEEEHRTLTLLLDTTPSMRAGERFDGARRVAALLGALTLARRDAVRVVTTAGEADRAVEAGSGGVRRLLEILVGIELDRDDAGVDPFALARQPIERGWTGTLCWISDFADPDTFGPSLRTLRGSGRRCVGVLPGIPTDRALPARRGLLEVVDPETGAREVVRVDEALRRELARELELLRRRQRSLFAGVGSNQLVQLSLPAPGDFRLDSWLGGGWTSRI